MVIPGTTILEGKRLVIAAVRPDVVAPFTSTKTARLDMNMGLTAGDWFPSNLTSINDQIVYTRSQEGDTVTIDVADEVDQVFRFFANNGTFQRNAQNRNTHDWVPKPGVPEGLASYGIVASATLTKPQAGWDYLLTAEFSWGRPPTSRAAAPAGCGSWFPCRSSSRSGAGRHGAWAEYSPRCSRPPCGPATSGRSASQCTRSLPSF